VNNRQLPFLDKVVILVNGAYGLVSLIILLIGSILTFFLINDIDFAEIKYLNDNVLVGTGVITEIFETGTTINDETVYGYDYIFLSPIGDLNWTSYQLGYHYKIGDTVEVEYNTVRPDVNRIKGMNNTPGGIFSLLFMLPFFVGIVWSMVNIKSGIRKFQILKIGEFTQTVFLRRESTPFRLNDRRVYKYVFNFTDKFGEEHQLKSNTNNPEKFEPTEKVIAVYDPQDPKRSFLVDSLPTGIPYYIKRNWC